MRKGSSISIDNRLQKKSESFIKKVSSDMYFQSELASDSMSFDWLDEIEFACPYLDNIIRNPKVALINEEDVVKIERAKKITVDSVKDLSRHTQYIDKIDEITNDVQPSKILIVHPEETFNTYENRFIYTLVDRLLNFVMKKEELLKHFEMENSKVLEYAASTMTGNEKVNIELKISSKEKPDGKDGDDFKKEIESIKKRLKRIRYYFTAWQRSEFMKTLDKAHVPLVMPPIKKTNLILKNPNFQIATRLWIFLQNYDNDDEDNTKDNLDTTGNDILKGILDDTFLMNYYVLDSISSSKREQKEKLAKYALVMITQQIQRAVSLLLNSGIEISEEEILGMIASGIKNEKSKRLVDSADIKNKFKNVIDEYLEKTKDYL